MSHKVKKSDIIFYIALVLIIGLSILGTILAIKKHNVDKAKVTNKLEEKIPYLTFNEVEESKPVDVFKEYPINPLKFDYSNNTVQISGLKDKEVENKINEKLSVLDSTENEYGFNYCNLNFNVSNVLSIECHNKAVNVNLVDGSDIKLEEIFNQKTDIYSALVKGMYNSECAWNNCYETPDDVDVDYYSTIENRLVEYLQNIKNNKYNLKLNESNIAIVFNENDVAYISYGEFPNDITIYDRFLNADIYENKVQDYCTPNSCYFKINDQNKYSYVEEEFINSKTYLFSYLSNDTSREPSYTDFETEETELDLKELTKILKTEILNKENLNHEGNNYVDLNVFISVYYHTNKDYQVTYTLTKKEFTKDNFIKYRLGDTEAKTIKEKQITKVNMLLNKNNNITYLNDNPKTEITNFEDKLYNYIMQELEKEQNDFEYYNNCEFAENYEECEANKDYHELIKEASYAIDNVKNRLYMFENKPGIGMAESYVNVFIPLDVFKESTNETN